ncbi:hypothetical protein SAMN02745866_03105 [Alteromonadaceae bacterium Bs31]|nr:hypothetical protein SAMN02745866_03105 [Alteromonadaceae bacterium Bs31]
MRVFLCDHCKQLVFFENTLCNSCNRCLGFDPAEMQIRSFEKKEGDVLLTRVSDGKAYRYCDNKKHSACNWVVEAQSPSAFCSACQYNNNIPRISDRNLSLWRKLEVAKKRLVYSMYRWNLHVPSKQANPETGLEFDFLEELEDQKVFTGHAEGTITINIEEADDAVRAKNRQLLNEPYRTLLGHFRHEVGHYFWDLFFCQENEREAFRAVFGDERVDYQESLKKHYENKNDSADWKQHYVTDYAASHPWEDWAETWAHYIHIVDTLETAYATSETYLKRLNAGMDFLPFNPYSEMDFDKIIKNWFPLTYSVNSINRSMGISDLYPFALTDGVIEKIRFIHDLLERVEAKGFTLPQTLNRSLEEKQ